MTRPAPRRTFVSAVFVRRTQTRAATNGAHYFTYRLVQSERTGTRVRQRTLLNLQAATSPFPRPIGRPSVPASTKS